LKRAVTATPATPRPTKNRRLINMKCSGIYGFAVAYL
jgi:hypothetical protein